MPNIATKEPPVIASCIKTADMVVTSSGLIGLLVDLSIAPLGAHVQFVNNGKIRRYNWQSLRRATMQEIVDAGMHGIGCNQMYDGVGR